MKLIITGDLAGGALSSDEALSNWTLVFRLKGMGEAEGAIFFSGVSGNFLVF